MIASASDRAAHAASGLRGPTRVGSPVVWGVRNDWRRAVLFHKHKERKLQGNRDARDVAQLQQELDQVTDSEGVVSIDGFQHFVEFVTAHRIDLASFPDVRTEVRLRLAQGGVFLPSEHTTLILKGDEASVLDTPVRLLKEVADREYVGGSRGFSIPLGGGVRYRAGAVRGHVVTIGSHWAVADEGMLTVTDRRVVYHGGRKTLEFPYSKLAALNVYSDAIDLGVTTRQSTSKFGTDWAALIAGIIQSAARYGEDLTILNIRFEG
jgi:hypothetical protein